MKSQTILLAVVCVVFLSLSSCGRSLEKQAREQFRTLGGASLDREDVEVLSVREQGSFAIVEIRVSTAVKMARQGQGWVLQEVRLGDRHWEDAQVLRQAIEQSRVERTRRQLQKVREALDRYGREHGQIPQTDRFEAVIDLLSPHYLPEVIRFDSWDRPFYYQYRSSHSYRLGSAGSDGVVGSSDDVTLEAP